MPSIHRHMEINAPVDKVFSYIEDPRKNPEWMENMTEVKDVTGVGKGSYFMWTWEMAGLSLQGKTINMEDKRIVLKIKGGIKCTWSYNLEPNDAKTILDTDIDYMIPVSVLHKMTGELFQKYTENSNGNVKKNIKLKLAQPGQWHLLQWLLLDRALRNLKRKLESQDHCT